MWRYQLQLKGEADVAGCVVEGFFRWILITGDPGDENPWNMAREAQ